jgi:nitrite reductase/ring-hydroxylating ferredoxin subunit
MQDPNPRYTKAPPTAVAAGDRMIVVARSGGELYAIEDGQVVCPRHGAHFKALIAVTGVWLFAEGIMAYCHVGP